MRIKDLREHYRSLQSSTLIGRRNVILLTTLVFLAFFVLVPVIPEGWPSGTYTGSIQYDCRPGSTNMTRLPVPYTVSASYAAFKVGMIYDDQLNPPHFGFEIGPTVHLPCPF